MPRKPKPEPRYVRMNITVPAPLREAMDQIDRTHNWSEIASYAFAQAVTGTNEFVNRQMEFADLFAAAAKGKPARKERGRR